MVITNGNEIVDAYTNGVKVIEIYANGVKVWPVYTPSPANNEIYYTSTDWNIVTPNTDSMPSGLNIVSNTYTPGIGGVIVFDNDISKVWYNMFGSAYSATELRPKHTLETVVLPSSITEIAANAFMDCDNLVSVNIPNGVTKIGSWAFRGCWSLNSLTIPASTVDITDDAFFGTSLQSLTVDSGNTVYDSRNNCNAIIETSTNTLIAGCDTTIIPSTVAKIGERAFIRHERMTSITIPSNVTTIDFEAFAGCIGLTQISLPGVTVLHKSAFKSCTGLVSVDMPVIQDLGGGTYLNNVGPFEGCTSLTTVTIPQSVIYIRDRAFYKCTSLSEVIVYRTNPPYMAGNEVFNDNAVGRLIKVPSGSVQAYKTASGWSTYAADIVSQ